MTNWDVQHICEHLFEAGRVALAHFDRPQRELKADQSIVTTADHEIETLLRDRLVEPTERNVAFLGEESAAGWTQAEVSRAFEGHTWVVDPIDGTAPYANHLDTWGISVALMERGTLTHGAIFLPRSGELFVTDADQLLFARLPADPKGWSTTLLSPYTAARPPYSTMGMVSLPHKITGQPRFLGTNPIQVIGCAVYCATRLLLGSYIGYITRVNLWDLAAAIPMLERSGFTMVSVGGVPLTTHVTEREWFISATDPLLWKSREMTVIGPNEETIRYLNRAYHQR